MNLSGKKLLVLTGCNGASDIIKYAKSKGVFVIATDYHKESEVKKMADLSYNISTTNVAKIEELAKKHNVDGITTGTSESSMYTILKVTNNLDLPFYTSEPVLQKINNKKSFKRILHNKGVGVTREYTKDSVNKFPVIVKPVDSSGGKGISVCYNEKELQSSIEHAIKYSRTKDYVIEEYIKDAREVFINYTIVNGVFSLSCTFDNFKNRGRQAGVNYQDVNIYPSTFSNEFVKKENNNLISALNEIGVRNGVISIQAFYLKGRFFVYEAGYRLGGSQSYVFSKFNNGISHLEMMVNYALTGKMEDNENVLHKDNHLFRYRCCQLNIPLKEGKIKDVVGLDEIEKLPEVLNITKVLKAGDIVFRKGTTNSLGARIHLYSEDDTGLEKTVNEIITRVRFVDNNGSVMNYNKNKMSLKDYFQAESYKK